MSCSRLLENKNTIKLKVTAPDVHLTILVAMKHNGTYETGQVQNSVRLKNVCVCEL
jgi:hypothetical protein